jgi:hypothetical protein
MTVAPSFDTRSFPVTFRILKERTMHRAKTIVLVVAAVALGILGPVGLAYAGVPPPRPIPNPGTLLLFTSGFVGLAWWLRKRD